jgi:hypothetical protein
MVLNYKDNIYRNGTNLTLPNVVSEMQGPDCTPGGDLIVENAKCDCARGILDVYVRYTFLPSSRNDPFTPTPDLLPMIVEAINHDQPVQVHWRWRDNTGHTVLIVGYRGDGDLRINDANLLIYNPLDPTEEDQWMSFNDVVNAKGLGQWVGWYSNFGV